MGPPVGDDAAQTIANAITATVDDCIAGYISIEECSAAIKGLWDKARRVSLHEEVSAILHEMTLAEVDDETFW